MVQDAQVHLIGIVGGSVDDVFCGTVEFHALAHDEHRIRVGVAFGGENEAQRGFPIVFEFYNRALQHNLAQDVAEVDFSGDVFLVAVAGFDVHDGGYSAPEFRPIAAGVDVGTAHNVHVEDGEDTDGVEGIVKQYAVQQQHVLHGCATAHVKLTALVASGDDARQHLQVLRKVRLAADGRHLTHVFRRDADDGGACFLLLALPFAHNRWSRAMLQNWIETGLYERQGKAITNFTTVLPLLDSDLAQEVTKDPYSFAFAGVRGRYNEKKLKEALLTNITHFLVELGSGFSYVGREYRLQFGEQEKFIDLLFYHLKLRCYVVVEVKIDDFDFPDVGQIGGYIVACNHILKQPDDNPTIGLLICKKKNGLLAQYSLESSSQPIAISSYELEQFYPVKVEGALPTISQIVGRNTRVGIQADDDILARRHA